MTEEMRFIYKTIPAQLVMNRENGLIRMGPHLFRRNFTNAEPVGTMIANNAKTKGQFEAVQEWCRDNLDDQVNWTFDGYHTVVINRDSDAVRFRLRWC